MDEPLLTTHFVLVLVVVLVLECSPRGVMEYWSGGVASIE